MKIRSTKRIKGCVGICLIFGVAFLLSSNGSVFSQEAAEKAQGAKQPKRIDIPPSSFAPDRPRRAPIVIDRTTTPIEERFARIITLDVREMNVIDVLKFLALKGDFNMITSDQVQGRVTLYLKNVSIGDALDIILISNRLAYYMEHDVVNIVSEKEYVSTFGKKYNDKNEVAIVQLQYAKPAYVLSTLDNIKSSLGRIIIDEDTGTVVMIDTPQALEEMKDIIARVEKPLEAVVYSLQFANADVIASKLRARIDAHSVGSITVDERTNKIIVRAFPGRREEVAKLLKILDAPTKEVLVEARVMQITFKPQFDFGIDWRGDFRNSDSILARRIDFTNIFLNDSNPTANLATHYSRIGFGDFSNNRFEANVRALKQVSTTKILSNPKILVTNNEEAKIHVGDTVPYIISTTSGTGDNAITSEDVRFVDVGLQLNVTPRINDDGFVTMVLRPEISSVTATITSQGGGIPQVTKTLVETTVMVKDGETVILGGLRKDNKVMTERGIPFLMDIPFLRRFFSSTAESIEATEIVIFITPHIVTGTGGYRDFKGTIKPDTDYEETKESVPVKELERKTLELKT